MGVTGRRLPGPAPRCHRALAEAAAGLRPGGRAAARGSVGPKLLGRALSGAADVVRMPSRGVACSELLCCPRFLPLALPLSAVIAVSKLPDFSGILATWPTRWGAGRGTYF